MRSAFDPAPSDQAPCTKFRRAIQDYPPRLFLLRNSFRPSMRCTGAPQPSDPVTRTTFFRALWVYRVCKFLFRNHCQPLIHYALISNRRIKRHVTNSAGWFKGYSTCTLISREPTYPSIYAVFNPRLLDQLPRTLSTGSPDAYPSSEFRLRNRSRPSMGSDSIPPPSD